MTRAARAALVTVAPGTSWSDPDLPDGGGLTFVEVDGRLVEAVLEVGDAATAHARAVQLPAGRVLERRGPPLDPPVGPVDSHLLLPAPAVTRARLHGEVGLRHGARRVARRRAMLTVDHPVTDPWVACERVLAVLPPRPRALRSWLRSRAAADTGAVGRRCELLTHGIDADPAAFLRAAGADRGPAGLRIHLVRRDDDGVAVVTDPSCGTGATGGADGTGTVVGSGTDETHRRGGDA